MKYKKHLQLAESFRDLHFQKELLLLPNSWDISSAIIYEKSGFNAIGSSSAGVAYTHGYPDGQAMPFSLLLQFVKNTSRLISIPFSVDIEMGFGKNSERIIDNIKNIIEAGAVGINIEDKYLTETNQLSDINYQSAIIEEISLLKDKLGIPFTINARVNSFWSLKSDDTKKLKDTIKRAKQYSEHGADCIFVPKMTLKNHIKELLHNIDKPLNILADKNIPSINELNNIGVRRVSLGSAPARAILNLTQKISSDFIHHGRFEKAIDHNLSYHRANKIFEDINHTSF